MIGRADIEGSKSNVAMNAWLPQASSLLPLAVDCLPQAHRFRTGWVLIPMTPSRMGVGCTLRVCTRTPYQPSRRAAHEEPCRLLIVPIQWIVTRAVICPSRRGVTPERLVPLA
jgi:hypothetical protein